MLDLTLSSGLQASHATFPPGTLPCLGYLGTAGAAGGIWGHTGLSPATTGCSAVFCAAISYLFTPPGSNCVPLCLPPAAPLYFSALINNCK